MLLKLLYDFAISKNLLEDPAFVQKPVRWVIQLDSDGRLVGDGPIETHGGEEKRALEFSIPKTTRPTGGGQVSDFLVDDIGALFNLNTKLQTEPKQRAINNLRGKYEDFWRQMNKAGEVTRHPPFFAVLKFHEQLQESAPSFLRLDTTGTPKWMVRKASGEEVKLGSDDLITFAVDGNILINDEDVVRPYWRRIHAGEMEESGNTAQKGICIVTGQIDVPIARTHTPMVTGLPKPARRTGAGVVGFESNAFCSYGFERSFNAPVSIRASKAYLSAIQYLSQQKDHRLSIGPAWLYFWADKTEAVPNFFARLLKQPDPRTIRDFMVSPWSGFEQPPNELERFIAITLSAAGPRIIVKDWLQITLKDAANNFKRWFSDLDIVPYGDISESQDELSPLSIDQIVCTTIRRKNDGRFDRDKLNPNLTAALYRAALRYESPPVTLLKPILDRFKSNFVKHGLNALYDQSRFALLRLTINRNRKESEPMIEPHVFETDDPAYNCGRLLAVFDSLQRSAHGKSFEGSTIAEKYFGAASTTPNTAFSLLWRLHQHHLKKLRQKDEKGQRAAARIKGSITQIAGMFGQVTPGSAPELPRYFTLIEQGRFALGFYQQMAARKAAIEEYLKKKKAGEMKPEEMDDEMEFSENE